MFLGDASSETAGEGGKVWGGGGGGGGGLGCRVLPTCFEAEEWGGGGA